MDKVILEIKNLTKCYGKVLAVNDMSLQLHRGEVFGFIGPNGAGKSTTIRSIMNLVNITSGVIEYNGTPLSRNDITLKEDFGYLPSDINLYDDYKVKDMLDFHESFYKKDIHDRRCELVSRLDLDESKKIEDLSLGNRKKLGIVLALMHSPSILILDEATSGLDPIMQNVFYDILLEEKKKGTTIFYSTHILSEVSKICDRVGIIKEGVLLNIESVKELNKKNFTFVTIDSKDIDSIVSALKLEVVNRDGSVVKLKNTLKPDTLIKKLAQYPIDSILIEQPSLEDIFLHYYR